MCESCSLANVYLASYAGLEMHANLNIDLQLDPLAVGMDIRKTTSFSGPEGG